VHKYRTKFDENISIDYISNVKSWTKFSPFRFSRQNHLTTIEFDACRRPTYRQAFDSWTHSLHAYCKNSDEYYWYR